jgi:short-subunit dehydrogenase
VTRGPVLILGARSDIARAVARRFAQAGHPVMLAARNASTLQDDRADLAIRHGVDVTLHDYDALDVDGVAAFVAGLPLLPEVAVCAVGLMGDQRGSETDPRAAETVMRSNYIGPSLVLGALAEAMVERGSGTLVGISSVAGERGRASNYVYGSAKAGFTAFLSGLRNRLARSGVHVVTVLPGFVATAMTAGMDLSPRLTAQPAEVGEAVFRAVARRRNVIHVRPVWRVIMTIIRALPEALFKRTKL